MHDLDSIYSILKLTPRGYTYVADASGVTARAALEDFPNRFNSLAAGDEVLMVRTTTYTATGVSSATEQARFKLATPPTPKGYVVL